MGLIKELGKVLGIHEDDETPDINALKIAAELKVDPDTLSDEELGRYLPITKEDYENAAKAYGYVPPEPSLERRVIRTPAQMHPSDEFADYLRAKQKDEFIRNAIIGSPKIPSFPYEAMEKRYFNIPNRKIPVDFSRIPLKGSPAELEKYAWELVNANSGATQVWDRELMSKVAGLPANIQHERYKPLLYNRIMDQLLGSQKLLKQYYVDPRTRIREIIRLKAKVQQEQAKRALEEITKKNVEKYADPYAKASQGQLDPLKKISEEYTNEPVEVINKIMTQYTMSPQARQAIDAVTKEENAAMAASGRASSPYTQLALAEKTDAIVKADQRNFYNQAMGVKTQGLGIKSELLNAGIPSAHGALQILNNLGQQLAGIGYQEGEKALNTLPASLGATEQAKLFNQWQEQQHQQAVYNAEYERDLINRGIAQANAQRKREYESKLGAMTGTLLGGMFGGAPGAAFGGQIGGNIAGDGSAGAQYQQMPGGQQNLYYNQNPSYNWQHLASTYNTYVNPQTAQANRPYGSWWTSQRFAGNQQNPWGDLGVPNIFSASFWNRG